LFHINKNMSCKNIISYKPSMDFSNLNLRSKNKIEQNLLLAIRGDKANTYRTSI
jgi:hypothetical protein